MQYRLVIQEKGSNDPPAVEKDFPTVEDAVAELVESIIGLEDSTAKLTPDYTGPGDWCWTITADTLFDEDTGDPIDNEIFIEAWDDDEFSSYEDVKSEREFYDHADDTERSQLAGGSLNR